MDRQGPNSLVLTVLGLLLLTALMLFALSFGMRPGDGPSGDVDINFLEKEDEGHGPMERILYRNFVDDPAMYQFERPIDPHMIKDPRVMSTIDWEILIREPHIIAGHEAEIVKCIAHAFKNYETIESVMEIYQSDNLVFPTHNPVHRSAVYAVNLGRAIDLLTKENILGPCAYIDLDVMQREWAKGLKEFNPHHWKLVAIFEHRIHASGAQSFVPKTAYTVWDIDNGRTFKLWLCDWQLIHRIYPEPYTKIECGGFGGYDGPSPSSP